MVYQTWDHLVGDIFKYINMLEMCSISYSEFT